MSMVYFDIMYTSTVRPVYAVVLLQWLKWPSGISISWALVLNFGRSVTQKAKEG